MIDNEEHKPYSGKQIAGAAGLVALVAGTPLYLKYGRKPLKDLKDVIKTRINEIMARRGLKSRPGATVD